jgi:PIN domain nuclease of toxin-antitoxin system
VTPEAVWDSSALLMVLKQEAGWELLADRVESAAMSTVNLSEVAAYFAKQGRPLDEIEEFLQGLALRLYPFTQEQAYRSAALRPLTLPLGLSLGDRACLALAEHLQLPVLTADQIWGKLDLGIEIQLAR